MFDDGRDIQERADRYREADERNTARRAEILGVAYVDMRGTEDTIPLVFDVMSIPDMYRYRTIPLQKGSYTKPHIYAITLSTPESYLRKLNADATKASEALEYRMISNSAFDKIMARYDPPKEVTYHNVEISSAGDSETLKKVSDELDKVRPDDILNYLILQADMLGASDIHIENERKGVRIRFRIDGALHPIAHLTHDKYRILFASIASAANLSRAAVTAQSGHIVREIGDLRRAFNLVGGTGGVEVVKNDDEDGGHTLNMRIETVPTSYGQDAVIRLFNFRTDMLSMDVLGFE